MMLRRLLVVGLVVTACAAPPKHGPPPPPASASPSAAPRARGPNILFLISDDQSVPDLGCYGNAAIGTPNVDRIAKEGMRFENAFVSSPQCSPSRAAILTGRSPVAVGMSRLHAALRPSVPSVLEPLKTAGYHVAAYRKVHLGDDFQKRWDHYGGFEEAPSSFFARRPKDRPFFLWVGFDDPHRPYPHATPFGTPHDPAKVIVPAWLPDTPKVRKDLAMYYDAIARMDHDAGEVLDALEKEGLTKDTLVMFAGDNGLPFPGAKGSLYDPGIRVPLLARWPGHIAAGAVDRDLASLLDLPATWLDAAGLPTPPEMEGRSFLGRLAGKSAPTREAVFVERDWHDTQDAIRAVRTTEYALIHNFRAEVAYLPTLDLAESPSWESIVELEKAGKLSKPLHQRLFGAPRPTIELYDIARDQNQTKNLASDPARAEDVKRLENLLGRWMISTNDYLPPPGDQKHGKHGESGTDRAP